jgi:hypothetical protein
MARPRTLRRRVDRVLSMTAVPQRISAGARFMIGAAIVPMAALSAVTFAVGAAPAPAAGQPEVATQLPAGINAAQLDLYVGRFAIGSSVLAVTRDGTQLFAQLSGYPKLRLVPEGGDGFVDERGEGHFTFVVADGRLATAVLLRADSNTKQGARIASGKADEIEAAFERRISGLAQRFRDQTPMPGARTALLQMIEGLSRDPPAYERMSPQLVDRMRRQSPQIRPTLEALGAPEQVFFRGVAPYGPDIYAVKFANGTAEFRIELTADGTITEANLRPDGDGTPGGVADCVVEPMLKSSEDTAPIRLSVNNRSGGGIRLFSLGPGGERKDSGELARDGSIEVTTTVGRPLVIADQAGQCHEIVLPGQHTRFHVVEPIRAAAFHGPSNVRRNTPLAGSDEALQRHLDGLRRGLPEYDRMTPEAATTTRRLLPQQRAILAGLGALRTMSFRGVSAGGEDVYGLRFAEGWAVWQIGLTDDGRIRSIALSP